MEPPPEKGGLTSWSSSSSQWKSGLPNENSTTGPSEPSWARSLGGSTSICPTQLT